MSFHCRGQLRITLREHTPPAVLAAFSAMAEPTPPTDAPPLPPPTVETDSLWYPDDEQDPEFLRGAPWAHDWASWLTEDSTGQGGGGRLQWASDRWRLLCDFRWQTRSRVISDNLSWLAPFVEPEWEDSPATLVGYLLEDGPVRPELLWVVGGSWLHDNLNLGPSSPRLPLLDPDDYLAERD